VVDKASF